MLASLLPILPFKHKVYVSLMKSDQCCHCIKFTWRQNMGFSNREMSSIDFVHPEERRSIDLYVIYLPEFVFMYILLVLC